MLEGKKRVLCNGCPGLGLHPFLSLSLCLSLFVSLHLFSACFFALACWKCVFNVRQSQVCTPLDWADVTRGIQLWLWAEATANSQLDGFCFPPVLWHPPVPHNNLTSDRIGLKLPTFSSTTYPMVWDIQYVCVLVSILSIQNIKKT